MNARTRRSLTLLWTALFLFSLALQSVTLATPAAVSATPTDGVFQLEGNATDGGAGEDWANIYAGNSNAQATTGILGDTAGRRFTQGSKDTLAMSQNSWDVASVPDKDDILHAFAALYDINGNDTIVFGLDRFANNGDAHAGFWFFQDQIGINANGTFSGQRTVGDVFIVSDFTAGGDLSTVKLYTWTGSGLSAPTFGQECAPGAQTGCAIANTDDEISPWPYLPKQGTSGIFPVSSFFEGGLNLDAVFPNGAPCISSFMAETRSSTSETAELKNFVLGEFQTCEPPNISTQVKQNGQNVSSINKGESVVDVATLSGTDGPVTGSIEFFVCGPGSSKPDCSNGGTSLGSETISNGSATSDPFTPTALGWYCFRAEYTPNAAAHYTSGEHTNSTTECFRVIPADVQIVKTPNNGTESAGTNISFTLSWTNEGEGSATGVVVSDTLPTGGGLNWSISGSTGTGSTCTLSAADVLTCNVGTIAGNPNFPNAGAGQRHRHADQRDDQRQLRARSTTPARSRRATTAPTPTRDRSPSSARMSRSQKTPDGGTVQAGATATFTIVVTNLGPGTATGVTLTDNLPAGYVWTLGGADAASCSINTAPSPDVLSCNFGSIGDDGTRTITLSAPTTGANCAVINNTAIVDAVNEPESANGNNSNSGSIDVLCAVIQIDKTANPVGPVSAGDEIGFDIVVRNTGDGIATNVVVTDELPAGVNWSIDPAVTGCSIDGDVGEQILTCTRASLAAGASFTVHIEGVTDALDCGTINNTAFVTTGNDGKDSDDASVVVLCPDIEVEKTGNGTIDAGGNAVFTIKVTNHGPGEAKGVTLVDQLPAGTWTLGGADAEDCAISATNLLSCDFGRIGDDGTRTITVTLTTTADDCGSILNTVTVSATNEPTNDQFPNTDNDTIVVQCPDLTVEKTGNGPISAGQLATFTITVTNLGPGAAANATLSDQLPAGDWTVGGADGADCAISASNLLTCDFGTIAAPGQGADNVRVITVSKTSEADDCDAILNTVTVEATNEAGEDTDDNDDNATIVVNCPDLQVVKDGNGPISAGEQAVVHDHRHEPRPGHGVRRRAHGRAPGRNGLDAGWRQCRLVLDRRHGQPRSPVVRLRDARGRRLADDHPDR